MSNTNEETPNPNTETSNTETKPTAIPEPSGLERVLVSMQESITALKNELAEMRKVPAKPVATNPTEPSEVAARIARLELTAKMASMPAEAQSLARIIAAGENGVLAANAFLDAWDSKTRETGPAGSPPKPEPTKKSYTTAEVMSLPPDERMAVIAAARKGAVLIDERS
jgi:hypothetical protein